MDTEVRKGRLDRWNDQKGFGFIRTDGNKRDIFLHISAFKKSIGRRPKVGDTIIYQVHTESDGKTRAVNAAIKGLAPQAAAIKSGKSITIGNRRKISRGVFIFLVIGAVVFAYNRFAMNFTGSSKFDSIPKQIKRYENEFKCQGKIYCSEMTSCEEAMFYQRNCPGTKMDGDSDGVPCESQWCG